MRAYARRRFAPSQRRSRTRDWFKFALKETTLPLFRARNGVAKHSSVMSKVLVSSYISEGDLGASFDERTGNSKT